MAALHSSRRLKRELYRCGQRRMYRHPPSPRPGVSRPDLRIIAARPHANGEPMLQVLHCSDELLQRVYGCISMRNGLQLIACTRNKSDTCSTHKVLAGTDVHFGEKLELVMKVLSLSRAGLASAIGVDKSVTGRWVSGQVKPSSHNLAKISQRVAEQLPAFTMLDWEREPSDFMAFIGASSNPATQNARNLWPLFPPKLSAEAKHAATERTKAYEGFWRTTRPSSDVPGQFLHDVSIVRRDSEGHLTFQSGVEGFYYQGSTVMVQQQLYYFAADDAFGAISFGILNGVSRGRADIVDGVILSTLRDAGASPTASSLIMHRIGDLSDDPDADDTRFRELAETQKMLAPEGSVPQDVADHLHRAANAPGMLRMLFTQSMSRGPLVDPAASIARPAPKPR